MYCLNVHTECVRSVVKSHDEMFLLKKFLWYFVIAGLEFDALFISTVRTYNTMTTETMKRSDLGFLSDPKLLNTAVTRAKYHLCIVGDPNALCAVGLSKVCWKTILAK